VLSRRAQLRDGKNALAIALDARRARGEAVLDLTASNPTVVGLVPPPEVLRALAEPSGLIYAPDPFGSGSARSAVARELDVPEARVVLTASTSEAYGHLLTLFCDPGDAVLVPRPSYPLLEVLARLAAVEVVHYDLAYDGSWHVDAASLPNDPRVKLVIAVSPNNPTGSYLSGDDFAKLASLGVPVILDEVFDAYALEGAPTRTKSASGLVISLGGLSKHVGMPQLKLAWMTFAGDAAAIDVAMDALAHITDAYLGLGTPVQLALPAILAAGAETRARILARLRANLAALDRALVGSTVSRLRVEGGWYAILHLPSVRSEEAWVLAMLEEGVWVQPGFFYDFASSPRLVVSLLTEEEDFREGLTRILAVVARALA
jgi:alanine-synthesizing transaminase